jgi:hypothetical protein
MGNRQVGRFRGQSPHDAPALDAARTTLDAAKRNLADLRGKHAWLRTNASETFRTINKRCRYEAQEEVKARFVKSSEDFLEINQARLDELFLSLLLYRHITAHPERVGAPPGMIQAMMQDPMGMLSDEASADAEENEAPAASP